MDLDFPVLGHGPVLRDSLGRRPILTRKGKAGTGDLEATAAPRLAVSRTLRWRIAAKRFVPDGQPPGPPTRCPPNRPFPPCRHRHRPSACSVAGARAIGDSYG